jgi:SAM-dependent methyltransferase
MNGSGWPYRIAGQLSTLKHRMRAWHLGLRGDRDYRNYLSIQFERTLSKRNQVPARRTPLVLEQLLERGSPSREASVLCIGPRDTFELDWFREQGFTTVYGIDLFSPRSDIMVMDMHRMKFPDNAFDVIYSSHSLEHSYDVKQVVSEILRVAKPGALVGIEVPVKYRTRGADRIDFGSVERVHNLFAPNIGQVLWTEEQPPQSPRNSSGTAVVRTVFSFSKDFP